MIKKEEVYKIGIFNKPHGIHGELSFTFTDDIFAEADCGYIVCLLDGIFIPFFIEESRFRSDTTALVKLRDINTAEQARMFTNAEVYFPVIYRNQSSEETFTWDYFTGFEVVDRKHGALGTISEVDTSTINTLFVIEVDEEELLIPAQEEFILEIDHDNRIIYLNLPDGLVNMEDAVDEEDRIDV